ncbi:DoxX family protein [Chryseolinea sp. T2]|uniref:DoxX family protein n=1 Tax=Chryseolinea sp. T2 TaxID=3129255 RepID=UPI003076D667
MMEDYLPVAGRIMFCAVFLITSPNAFKKQTIQYAGMKGVPFPSLAVPLSGIIEIAGSLSIILNYHPQLGGSLIVMYLLPVTLSMHNFWSFTDPMTRQIEFANFLKNLSIMGGAVLIVAWA